MPVLVTRWILLQPGPPPPGGERKKKSLRNEPSMWTPTPHSENRRNRRNRNRRNRRNHNQPNGATVRCGGACVRGDRAREGGRCGLTRRIVPFVPRLGLELGVTRHTGGEDDDDDDDGVFFFFFAIRQRRRRLDFFVSVRFSFRFGIRTRTTSDSSIHSIHRFGRC